MYFVLTDIYGNTPEPRRSAPIRPNSQQAYHMPGTDPFTIHLPAAPY